MDPVPDETLVRRSSRRLGKSLSAHLLLHSHIAFKSPSRRSPAHCGIGTVPLVLGAHLYRTTPQSLLLEPVLPFALTEQPALAPYSSSRDRCISPIHPLSTEADHNTSYAPCASKNPK
uniref:Uncharacterized protein n=1 Tax=Mycena chlorophos TaxID=658473 RepID=A0ABQ0LMX6_MYCCL|nr:predicted protein [Mycena chlorophos]